MSIIGSRVGAAESKLSEQMIMVSSRYSLPDRRLKVTTRIHFVTPKTKPGPSACRGFVFLFYLFFICLECGEFKPPGNSARLPMGARGDT